MVRASNAVFIVMARGSAPTAGARGTARACFATAWAKVPEPIRKIVEQHVASRLPAKILAKLRDLHARGLRSIAFVGMSEFGLDKYDDKTEQRILAREEVR